MSINLRRRVPVYVTYIVLSGSLALSLFLAYAAIKANIIGQNWQASVTSVDTTS